MIRLAVFDDEFVVVEGVKAILKKMHLNYEVVGVAYDGISALDVIKEVQPDVIMTDIRMPGMDGLQMIDSAKAIVPDAIFIVISGFQEFEYARTALNLGVVGYIDKPITKDKINTILKKVESQIQEEKNIAEKDAQQLEALHHLTEVLTKSVQNNQSEGFEENITKALEILRALYPDLETYKSESYKLICSLLGVFFDGHAAYEVDKHFPSYKNLELIHSVEEVNHYILTISDSMIKKIKVLQTGSQNQTIIKALDYISENYSKDFGLNELADMAKVTPSYLSLLFKEEVGTSFIKYLTQFRIKQAKELLLRGEKVAYVSQAVGYSNYRYFCELFKRYEGKTPSEYKGARKEV
jgi:two-component system response regulator YesN